MITQGVVDNRYGGPATFGGAYPSRIEERQGGASFIQDKPMPSTLVASRYMKERPYGQPTTSVIGGISNNYQYQGVAASTPRDMIPQPSHYQDHVRPSYGFLNTESGAQSKIRSPAPVSEEFIKHF